MITFVETLVEALLVIGFLFFMIVWVHYRVTKLEERLEKLESEITDLEKLALGIYERMK